MGFASFHLIFLNLFIFNVALKKVLTPLKWFYEANQWFLDTIVWISQQINKIIKKLIELQWTLQWISHMIIFNQHSYQMCNII